LQQAWLNLIARSLLLALSVLAAGGEPDVVYDMPYGMVGMLPLYSSSELLDAFKRSTQVLQVQLQHLGLPGDAAATDGGSLVLPGLLQQLSALQGDLQSLPLAATDACGDGFTAELRAKRSMFAPGLLQQLRGVCSTVCLQLPHKHSCNYEGCTNMTTLSELQLAHCKQSICSACKMARFCSKECQKQAWKEHKLVCKSLTRAAQV
jgi:hypothetical protein